MELTIVGLPKSGKTTIFNCATLGSAETSAFSVGADKPNLGVAKVPDQRLNQLSNLYNPKRTTAAEVKYVDLPGTIGEGGSNKGISGEYLNQLQRADALVEVVRAFDDPSLPHSEGTVDPTRDIETLDLELAFVDLSIIERRVDRLEASLKSAKTSERDQVNKEQALMARIKESLEKDSPIRAQSFTSDEWRVLEGFQFLTAKPLLVVLNIGEDSTDEGNSLTNEIEQKLGGPNKGFAPLCGQLEMELVQLDRQEAEEFRASLGIKESGLERMVRLSYDILGLISFFTVGQDEVRAWTIKSGTPANQASGKVHSDIERGFIRAEVVTCINLLETGGWPEAKKQGKLNLEGKTYIVQDGDVVSYLFNV